VFAALWPMSLALCVQLFVGRQSDHGKRFTGPQLVWRTVVVGVLASLGTAILPLPATLVGSLSHGTLQGFVYAAELVAITAVAVPVLFAQWRRLRSDAFTVERYANRVIVGYSLVYLAVMAVLWLTALPAYFSAVDGITPNGDPTGSLWYATVCFVVAGLCAAAAATVTPRPARQADAVPTEAADLR
jgi:hypothetical protein